MLRAYNRLHEAWKRLIILAHIIWWAWIINKLLKSYSNELWDVLIYLLGPPVITLIVLNMVFWFVDQGKKNNPNPKP